MEVGIVRLLFEACVLRGVLLPLLRIRADFGDDGTERGRVWGKLLWSVLLFLRPAFHFSADRLIIHSFFRYTSRNYSIPIFHNRSLSCSKGYTPEAQYQRK